MRRYVKEMLLLIMACALLLLAACWLWPVRASETRSLKMTAGDAVGLRHKLALEFAKEAAKVGVKLEIQPTSGSEAAIERVRNGELDLAFVQGGLATENFASVRQLTAMHIEPLHLLVRQSLFVRIEADGLSALNDCAINLGPIGSGTQILASEVLRFAGLEAVVESATGQVEQTSTSNEPGTSKVGSYRAIGWSYAKLSELSDAELPDAIFTVSSLPSPLADQLIEQHNFRLVALPFGEALSLEAFLQLGNVLPAASADKRHLFETEIPAYTYSVNRSEPPQSLKTIGTRLLLVASEQVPDRVVSLLLDALYHSNFAQAERPALDAALLDLPPEFPLHAGSLRYRQRNKPLIAGDAIDYWEKVIAIAATLLGGSFFLVQWYMRLGRRRREVAFADYIQRVLAIETAAMKTELSAQMNLADLVRLQRELSDLKADAVSKFATGEMEGEGLIHGFLTLVNDARDQITRLILHQRDNIEERAAEQHSDASALWNSEAEQANSITPTG